MLSEFLFVQGRGGKAARRGVGLPTQGPAHHEACAGQRGAQGGWGHSWALWQDTAP